MQAQHNSFIFSTEENKVGRTGARTRPSYWKTIILADRVYLEKEKYCKFWSFLCVNRRRHKKVTNNLMQTSCCFFIFHFSFLTQRRIGFWYLLKNISLTCSSHLLKSLFVYIWSEFLWCDALTSNDYQTVWRRKYMESKGKDIVEFVIICKWLQSKATSVYVTPLSMWVLRSDCIH